MLAPALCSNTTNVINRLKFKSTSICHCGFVYTVYFFCFRLFRFLKYISHTLNKMLCINCNTNNFPPSLTRILKFSQLFDMAQKKRPIISWHSSVTFRKGLYFKALKTKQTSPNLITCPRLDKEIILIKCQQYNENCYNGCINLSPWCIYREESAALDDSQPVQLFWKADQKCIHQIDDGNSTKSFSFGMSYSSKTYPYIIKDITFLIKHFHSCLFRSCIHFSRNY